MHTAAIARDWASIELLTTQLRALEDHHDSEPKSNDRASSPAAFQTSLTLTLVPNPTHASPVSIIADEKNTSGYGAVFTLPTTITPGEYVVSVSNGAATGELSSFYSQDEPVVTTIIIKPARVTAWSTAEFPVTAYGCNASVNFAGKQLNCTLPLQKAMAAARAAGGGLVRFGLGRFYITGPILVYVLLRASIAGLFLPIGF
jgi:hypothetical protein